MESMRNRMRGRRLRGLVLHHRRHPSAHPRRLVTRTASWGEPSDQAASVAGATSTPPPYTSPGTTTVWRPTASHQDRSHVGIQVTMCEGCGGPAAEIDHRLAINVARATGTRGAQEGVHTGEPALALQLLPPAQDPARPKARAVPGGLLTGLARSPAGLESQPCLGGRVPRSSRDS